MTNQTSNATPEQPREPVKNDWEKTCRMCDKPLFWSTLWDSWQHTENRSIYCPSKTASVAEPESKEAAK